MIENERAWLVKEVPESAPDSSKEIAQHYISEGKDPLRLRRAAWADGNGYLELTKKITIDDRDLSRKEEINIPLTDNEYAALLTLSKRGLEKTRRAYKLTDGLTAELDEFHGPLEGFTKVEVEFPNDAVRQAFSPPAWFGREITEEAWSKNSNLAGKTFSEISEHLN